MKSGGEWDIVTYRHSFEHVPDPQAQLDQVAKLLAPGGVCIVRIPTASSFAWEYYGVNWAQLDAPRHFFLHSRESMRRLALRAGLEVYAVVDDSRHFQFSGSEKYIADTAQVAPREKGVLRFLGRKWRKWGYSRRARRLNREGGSGWVFPSENGLKNLSWSWSTACGGAGMACEHSRSPLKCRKGVFQEVA